MIYKGTPSREGAHNPWCLFTDIALTKEYILLKNWNFQAEEEQMKECLKRSKWVAMDHFYSIFLITWV